MSDTQLVERVRSMKPVALARVASMPGAILDITDPEIIEAAWGARRVSSRSRGMVLRSYPERVTASRSLWERWLREDTNSVAVVIAKKKAQARINAALGCDQGDPEYAEAEPYADISHDEINDMLAERAELRAAQKFVEADKIRDYLISHGITVSDAKVAQ